MQGKVAEIEEKERAVEPQLEKLATQVSESSMLMKMAEQTATLNQVSSDAAHSANEVRRVTIPPPLPQLRTGCSRRDPISTHQVGRLAPRVGTGAHRGGDLADQARV